SKLYPGAGSSYFFAEQAFLSKTRAFRFARIAKFIIGWASHLYYWIYPGVMGGVTALLGRYPMSPFWPALFSPAPNRPLFLCLFCILSAAGVGYIAYRGVTSATAVNVAINVIQISALLIFSVIALGYRLNHGEGSVGWTLDPDGAPTQYVLKTDDQGNPVKNEKGEWVPETDPATGQPKLFTLTYKEPITQKPVDPKNPDGEKQATFQYHDTAASVVSPHGMSYIIIQACIAILILVGFESVTSMGEEAKNAKRDIPRAVLLSLLIQGVVCYLIQY